MEVVDWEVGDGIVEKQGRSGVGGSRGGVGGVWG